MKYDLDVKGDIAAAKRVDLMAAAAEDLKPALNKCADILARRLEENFKDQGQTLGLPWKPLAASTVERKGGGEPMVQTGALRAALSGGAGAIKKVTKAAARVGVTSDVYWAQIHEAGYSTVRDMPARNLVGWKDTDVSVFYGILSRHIQSGGGRQPL